MPTTRDYIINSEDTDLIVAYFDTGPSWYPGVFRICNDDDWLLAIAALRKAACLFKLPASASASIDIVTDAGARTAFFTQIHRSTHLMTDPCNTLGGSEVSEPTRQAIELAKKSLEAALKTLDGEPPSALPRVTGLSCGVVESCGGETSIPCDDRSRPIAFCKEYPPGTFRLTCVATLRPDDEPSKADA